MKHFSRLSVTVSVWNDFHSPQLVAGLQQNGFDVTHLTTARKKVHCSRFIQDMPAALLNQLAFRHMLPNRAAFGLSRFLIDNKGARLARTADAFWGWSSCSLAGIRRATQQHIPAILEHGSSHAQWRIQRMAAELRNFGLKADPDANPAKLIYDKEEYRLATRICIPSRFVWATFREMGVPEEKLFVNPYGADIDFWSQAQPHRSEASQFTFLWVAAVMPRKGIRVLLEAWKCAALKAAKLVIIGGIDPLAKPLLVNLPANVEVRQFLNHESIRREMEQSHAYILPSFEEGMARSVLEAGAAGLPLIITEETGATDIFKDGRDGWVVPSGDIDALVDVLQRVANDPDDAARRGQQASASVRPFSWEAYGSRAAVFLQGLL